MKIVRVVPAIKTVTVCQDVKVVGLDSDVIKNVKTIMANLRASSLVVRTALRVERKQTEFHVLNVNQGIMQIMVCVRSVAAHARTACARGQLLSAWKDVRKAGKGYYATFRKMEPNFQSQAAKDLVLHVTPKLKNAVLVSLECGEKIVNRNVPHVVPSVNNGQASA